MFSGVGSSKNGLMVKPGVLRPTLRYVPLKARVTVS